MIRTVASLASYINGYPFKPDDLGRDGTPVVRIKQLLDPSAEIDRCDKVIPQRFVISDGDLIFSWSGTLAVRIWDRGSAYLNQHLFRVEPAAGVENSWLKYALNEAIRELSGHMHGSAMTHITKDMMQAVSLELPSEEEQRRIADFLDDRVAHIDQVIEARQEQNALIEQLARSGMAASLLVGGDETPLARLIADERAGLWGDEAGVSGIDVRVARVADFDRRQFLLGDAPTVRSAPFSQVQSRLLMAGDVLLEKSGGTNLNPVGCPAFVEQVTEPTVSSNFVTRLRPSADTDGRYLALVLGALYATRQQEPHSTQTTGIQNLSTGSYFRTLVPKPSLAEQKRIAREADRGLCDARAQQTRLERSITLLQEYKQSLITAAVTGEFDVATASMKIPEN